MDITKRFRPYEPDQLLLMPPDLNDWLPDYHLAFFIRDVVKTMELAKIYEAYDGSQVAEELCEIIAAVRKLEALAE